MRKNKCLWVLIGQLPDEKDVTFWRKLPGPKRQLIEGLMYAHSIPKFAAAKNQKGAAESHLLPVYWERKKPKEGASQGGKPTPKLISIFKKKKLDMFIN